MAKISAGVGIATVLTMVLLAGCGGKGAASAQGGYCQDVQAAKDSITRLMENDITQQAFLSLARNLHTLGDEAPSEVKHDWATFSLAVDEFKAALSRTGMTMDEMARMQRGHMASGPAMDRAMAAARSMGSIAVGNALAGITTHVQKECGIDLDG
jgi:hypothetical protein